MFEYDMESRKGSIGLIGGPYTYRDDECVTMLLQKQTAFIGTWQCDIDLQPDEAGLEAFTTAWWSRDAFASVGVRATGSDGSKEVVFRKPRLTEEVVFDVSDTRFTQRVSGSCAQEETRPIPTGSVIRARIKTDFSGWTMGYSVLDKSGSPTEWVDFEHVPTQLLVRDRVIDSNFIGTHLGIYASGIEHRAAMVPAYFSNVTWDCYPWEHPQ